MTDLFEEVREDIRQEQFQKFWKKYGNWVIGLVILILVVTAGVIAWQNWCEKKQNENAAVFGKAIKLEATDRSGAVALYEQLLKTSPGFATLASFRLVTLDLRQALQNGKGDLEPVINRLKGIEEHKKIALPYREFATLLRVGLAMENGRTAELVNVLEPLTGTDRPWRALALELKGVLLFEEGKKELGAAILSELASAREAPQAFSTRAKALAQRFRYILEGAGGTSAVPDQEKPAS